MMMNNNNTTLEICVNSSSHDKSLHISYVIWHVFGFISIIIGIPGHIFQIIILSSKANIQKEPTSLYLIAIAICELIFLLALFWLWCANMSLIKIDPRQVLSCGIFYMIIIGSTTLSNLYLASLAIDRSIMILRPARYRLIVTPCHVILRMIVIYIIIALLLIPHHFYFYYEPKTTLFLCDFHSFAHRQIRLWTLVHSIFFVSIPSLLVCISAFILLRNRSKHKRTYKNNLSKSARRLHKRSIIIFFLSIGIFLSLLPTGILKVFIVYDRFFYHDISCTIRWKIYKILLNCFLTLSSINYSMKFYINLIISTSFRNSFIQFISCKSNQHIPGSPKMNSESNNEQHLLQTIDINKTKFEEI